jgi:hypothetical protein
VSRGPIPQAIAERVLTDVVLLRMVAYQHVIGPFRPARGLFVRALRRMWSK